MWYTGFHTEFFSGGKEFRKEGAHIAKYLFDHTHFAEITPIRLKIVSGLELVTSILEDLCVLQLKDLN